MSITGTGLPLVTPFDDDGDVDHEGLADLVSWVETRGIDFIVPAGSNSEAPMLRTDEHAAVVETVRESASIPVMAGTGTPGYGPTLDLTRRAADAGAEGALVVTPFYYDHDQDALEIYYRDLADEAPIPIYLYSVPAYTHKPIDPEVVGRLAEHPNIQGMKDSSGNIDRFYRTLDRVGDADFDLFVGSGGVYAPALDAGASGGILALANVAPDLASAIYERHTSGDREGAHALNDAGRDLNFAVTATHGIPGLKAAMKSRGAPAGELRRPHRPVDDDVADELAGMVEEALMPLEATP
jgi:dihydrodipicolinate synthase/N-acetylneuraminate lyase